MGVAFALAASHMYIEIMSALWVQPQDAFWRDNRERIPMHDVIALCWVKQDVYDMTFRQVNYQPAVYTLSPIAVRSFWSHSESFSLSTDLQIFASFVCISANELILSNKSLIKIRNRSGLKVVSCEAPDGKTLQLASTN